MSEQNIIKDMVLKKLKEANAEHFAEIRECRNITTEYQHRILGNGTDAYIIRAIHGTGQESATTWGDCEVTEWLGHYTEVVWEYEQWQNRNIMRVSEYFCGQSTGGGEGQKRMMTCHQGTSLYDMEPVTLEVPHDFADRWNLEMARRHDDSLKSPKITPAIYRRILSTRKIIEQRRKNPKWQTICDATKQLCRTAEGKTTARELIQTFLGQTQQHTR